MTMTAPRTAPSTRPAPRGQLDQARGFLHWLYEDQRGYIEIVAGAAQPDRPEKIDLDMHSRRWCYYDRQRPDLIDEAARYIVELAGAYGNVYIGCRLYEKRAKVENTRKEAYTLPSRVIFVDDAPAAPVLPYSASIRTSEGSRHAYYKCDRPITKDDARRAAAALGGDSSGIDLTQLVRVPGTFNTKNGGRWHVRSEQVRGPIYTLDRIRAAFPEVEPTHKGGGLVEPIAWPEVEQHLSNIGALLASSRAQLIKPNTQTGRILAGEMIAFTVKGKIDDSRSMNACAVAHGLLLRGFPDEEISAVLFDLYRKWGSEDDKGTAWVKLDIGRCLADAHQQHPNAKQSLTRYRPTQPAQPIADRLPISRARLDRPQRFTPAALFAAYQERPELCSQPRKGRAARLEISTATLDRLEDSLETLGLIAIEQVKRGLPGRVLMLGGVINIPAPEVLSPAAALGADEVASIGTVSEQTAIEAPQYIGETHPPPEPPSPPAPPAAGELRRWCDAAFDALADAGARYTFARVRKFVLADAAGRPVDLGVLKRLYRAELERRQWARQEAREAEKARKLSRKALVRKSKNLSSAAAAMRRKADPRAPIWLRLAGIYAAEEQRRDEQEARREGYTLAEEHTLLDQVDDLRLDLRARRIGRAAQPEGGTRGGACVPHSAPVEHQAPEVELPAPNADVLIARLHVLKAQRRPAELFFVGSPDSYSVAV